uniref:Uncharacterized protein n=1 Tax=Hyaloperonospora arabidopsidis (strain Emoy2) TaxID=559515 RepID=M4BQ68_HYAAE
MEDPDTRSTTETLRRQERVDYAQHRSRQGLQLGLTQRSRRSQGRWKRLGWTRNQPTSASELCSR